MDLGADLGRCLGGTIYFFQDRPKSFLPVGDSGFMFGVMIGAAGRSPEQMHRYQTAGRRRHAESTNRRHDVHGDGIEQFMQSNQGFMLAFLKDPKERGPAR